MTEYEQELLSDDDFRDLAEAAHILSELENEPGFITFKELVELDCRKRQELILSGKPESLESYRFHTGYVAGIMAAMSIPARVRAIHRGEIERRMPPAPEPEEVDDPDRVYAGY